MSINKQVRGDDLQLNSRTEVEKLEDDISFP